MWEFIIIIIIILPFLYVVRIKWLIDIPKNIQNITQIITSCAPKQHSSSTINCFAVSPAASRSEIHSRRSCQEEKWKLQMTCDVMRKVTAVSACTAGRMAVKGTIREAMMHWPHLTPLPLCMPPCRHPPLSLLNPDPPSASAASICMSPRWNKVMWQAQAMCFYCT